MIVQRCSPAVLSRLFSAQQALEEAIASLEGNDVGALSEIDVALAKVEASLIEIELEAFFADPCYTRWLQTSQ